MSGTMTLPDLAADLKASLLDAASMFTAASDADFKRHIGKAAEDFSRCRSLRRKGILTLVADQAEYTALPTDYYGFSASLWGIQPIKQRQPWETGFEPLPRVRETTAPDNPALRALQLDPPPSATQLTVLGNEFRFYYYAHHTIDANTSSATTILPGDRNLLLLRGQAEAMRELAMRGVAKPVQLRDGLGMGPRNGHPAALYDQLLKEFNLQAAA